MLGLVITYSLFCGSKCPYCIIYHSILGFYFSIRVVSIKNTGFVKYITAFPAREQYFQKIFIMGITRPIAK